MGNKISLALWRRRLACNSIWRRQDARATIILALLLFLAGGLALGWPWNTDMYWHQTIRRQEIPPLAPAEMTVTRDQEPPSTRDESKNFANPAPPTPESVVRGKELYRTFCSVCHGDKGLGDGPVAPKFVTPANLTLDMYKNMSDGYIYGTIRNGGANMPPQGTALSPAERWDAVNYVRSLQKQ